jgi:hypothetical protein
MAACAACIRLRHHRLYVPRFVKRTLTLGFDFHRLVCAAEDGRSHDTAGAEDRPIETLREDVR